MAAGSSSRTGGYPKQLLTLDGESIIKRAIRLIRDVHPGIPVYIVSWRHEFEFPDCGYIYTGQATPSLSHSILFTIPYWKQVNYIFLGDVIYTPELVREILDTTSLTLFGSYHPFKGYTERYAVVFSFKDGQNVVDYLVTSVKFKDGGLEALAHSMRWWTYLIHRVKVMVVPRKDARSRTHGKIWQFWNNLWMVPGVARVVRDSRVMDIDTFEEYFDYCLSFGDQPDSSLVFEYGETVRGVKRPVL